MPYDDWWRVIVRRRYEGADGLFVHPVDDARVMAGNGTIGLELLEDLPELDAVVVPYGGGGLLTGIASAVKAQRPGVRVLRGRAGDRRARRRPRSPPGEPAEVDYVPLVRRRRGQPRADAERVAARVRSCSTARSRSRSTTRPPRVRLIAERVRVIAEGAGALALAAARRGQGGRGATVVCIVSGGNIDPLVLGRILAGETP